MPRGSRSLGVMLALFLLLPLPAALATDEGAELVTDQETTADTPPIAAAPVVYDMYFPIQGGATYDNNFGDPRSGHSHAGIDIMKPKMTPLLAVASGTVGWMHNNTDPTRPCCAFELNHDDGWESYYIHMNNDTPGTDDGLGWGFAPGIERGARVEAGQLVGWVGDSGNAEGGLPHLHYELHKPGPDGGHVVINPYHSLNAATVLNAPLGSGNPRGCDYNDDGYDDLAIGVAGEDLVDNTKVDAGAVAVLYGTESGLAIAGVKAFTQRSAGVGSGANSDEEFGYTTACGDVNGDGYDDLVVGVPGEQIGPDPDSGAINLILGSQDGLAASGTNFWHQNRPGVAGTADAGDRFGEALAIGDFNDDGFADLAVGAPGETLRGRAAAGMVTVLYGSASGFDGTSANFSERTPGISGGLGAGDRFGAALAAGDFDNDGRSDLAIGIPGQARDGHAEAGAVVTLYGTASGLDSAREARFAQDAPGVGGGRAAGEMFGSALASGDFDGDDRMDLAIGVPADVAEGKAAGGVNILYGSGGGLVTAGAQHFQQGANGLLGTSEEGDLFGSFVSYGDFDGDGNHDLAVGAPGKTVSALSNAGSVHVIQGSSLGLASTGDSIWSQDTPGIRGAAQGEDGFGSWLSTGDFSGSGLSWLVVGVPAEDIGAKADAGATQIIRGRVGTGLGPAGDQRWHQSDAGFPGSAETGDAFGHVGM
ncbi:peptidoglycan DD-metalloendopeptidase family protein [Actinomycetota bacterium]